MTKKKNKFFKNFCPLNLHILASYALVKDNEIMTSACNLIISALVNQDGEYIDCYNNQFDLFLSNLKTNESHSLKPFCRVEIIWITLLGYCLIFIETSMDIKQQLLNRIVNCVK
jgi:hypothetical protein